MRIVCLSKVWDHHTASGGYDCLASAVGAKIIKRNASVFGANTVGRNKPIGIASRIAKKLWHRSTNSGSYMLNYQFEDWLAEHHLLLRCLVDPPDVVHVLYGDEQIDLLLRWRSFLRCPLVVTFHIPAEQVAQRFEHFQSKEIKGIDAAIVVAKSEVARFERWFGPNKVVYIPHGIDTEQFWPDRSKSTNDKLRLLIVGAWLRDWDLAHRVIDEAERAQLDIQFDVVTFSEFFPYFTGCSNVNLHPRVSELKLIELYREADALFLPLKNATGNNAVLEALACGTPVITTDVGGLPDYVTGDCGWLIPKGDVAAAVELIKKLCFDHDIARSRREAARAQALKFDWQRIAERVSVVYSAVHSGQSPSAAVKEFEQAVRSRAAHEMATQMRP